MFEKLDAKTLALFDKENAECDRLLARQREREAQSTVMINKTYNPAEQKSQPTMPAEIARANVCFSILERVLGSKQS